VALTEPIMSDVPIAQPIAVAEAVIGDDTPCINCGYNLRGLVPSGLCPECGSPINRSVHGDFLRYSDPAWLNKLLLGVTLMLWNMLLGLCLGFSAGIGAVLMGGAGPFLMIAVQCLAGGLGILAIYLLTAQEPRTALSEDPVTWRKALRFCTVTAFVGQLLIQLGATMGPHLWLIGTGYLICLTGVVAYIGQFIYLRRFALRVPDARLARSTRTVMWGMVITNAAAVMMGIAALFIVGVVGPGISAFGGGIAAPGTTTGLRFPGLPGTRPLPAMIVTSGPAGVAASAPAAAVATPVSPFGPGSIAGMITIGIFGCGIGVASLVFLIWYIVLLFGYRRVFGEALTIAKQIAGQAMPAR